MARSLSRTLPATFLLAGGLAFCSWTWVATTPLARSCATADSRSSASTWPVTTPADERPRYANTAMMASCAPAWAAPGRPASGQRDSQHFFDCGDPFDHLGQAGLAQALHPLALGDVSQFGGRCGLQNHIPQLCCDRHDFVEGHPSLCPREGTPIAALAPINGHSAWFGADMAVGHEGVLVDLVGFLAM